MEKRCFFPKICRQDSRGIGEQKTILHRAEQFQEGSVEVQEVHGSYEGEWDIWMVIAEWREVGCWMARSNPIGLKSSFYCLKEYFAVAIFSMKAT